MSNKLKGHKVTVFQSSDNPIRAKKVRPNDPCPCGSGKKAKNCCGVKTRYFSLVRKED